MRIAISGATGFVGSHLVPALLDRGDEVTVLVRPSTDASRVDSRARRADTSAESLAGVEAIVNLAGAGVLDERWSERRLALVRSSRVDTTKRLASLAKDARVFVSASAVGIYGMRRDDAELDESSPLGDDALARICVDWESAAKEARGRVALARIGIVLGKGGGALERMLPVFRRFVGGPLGSGEQWLSWIQMVDVVRALTFAIDDARLEGPFDVTAPAPVTMNDFARALGRALHRPHAMRVPETALRLALGEGANVLLTGQRVLPKKLLAAGFSFEHPDLASALQSSI
jgi:uncharacterized protein